MQNYLKESTMKQKLQELVNTNQNFTRYLQSQKCDKALKEYVLSTDGKTLMEKVYNALNDCPDHACKNCGSHTQLVSITSGYRDFCNQACINEYNKKDRLIKAINKLNSFGNLEYISGYETSHSKVFVRNKKCGHRFEATYLNLFTNSDYCSVCGPISRKEKLIKRNELGRSEESKKKLVATFSRKREEAQLKVKLKNEILENLVIIGGRESIVEFIKNILEKSKASSKKYIKRMYPKIYSIIDNHIGEKIEEKLYNYINKIDSSDNIPKCRVCLGDVLFKQHSRGYLDFCSHKCRAEDPRVLDRAKETNLEKYGAEWFTQTYEYLEKRKTSNLLKYGVEHVLQDKKIMNRTFKAQFRMKSFVLPSGRKIELMGYEPQVLASLLESTYTEEDFEFDKIPTIKYGARYYFPDLFLPEKNLIIEVKSQYTYEMELEKNLAKKQACIEQGYDFEFHIWDDKTKLAHIQ